MSKFMESDAAWQMKQDFFVQKSKMWEISLRFSYDVMKLISMKAILIN